VIAVDSPLQLGVFLLAGQHPGMTQRQALAGTIEAALAAERAGLDSVWIAEHHFITYGVCPSAITMAANILGRTRRIGVGTAVCMLANRHPVALAEETALLDQLTPGRFQLGVGRGGPWVDLEVFGTGLDRYEHGFPESLDLLLACLHRGRVAANGPRFRFREVPIVPRPATRPRVIVAATSMPTVDLAAAHGLPLLLGMHASDDDKVAMLERYDKVAARHGHDPERVEHRGAMLCQVADSHREALARLRAAMPAWIQHGLGGYVSIAPTPRPRREPQAHVEQLLAVGAVGTAKECAERLANSARRTGVRHLLLMVEGTGQLPQTLDTIRRLGAEVAPGLTDQPHDRAG
jgi:alkanesulfonate monooxygenase SsuD/methylene tetrahydromethanopterin reductase-like flavin-dependent oxidoreductase (luciferase family)